MYLVYSLALSIAFLILLPYFVYQAIKHGKYSGNLTERFGLLPVSLGAAGPTIWLHTVSVGEFLAARPLIGRLASEFPGHRLVVSTTTLTGQRLARDRLGGGEPIAHVFYFPFDWLFSVRRSLNRVKPALVILFETELWPNFLHECRRHGIETVVANGRISARSFSGYSRIRPFISRALRDVTLLIMQSADDYERVVALGADPARVRVCGSLKYDVPVLHQSDDADRAKAAMLDRLLALGRSAQLIVAGSTETGEEELILESLRRVRQTAGLDAARLVIAPRRPERFAEVAALIARSGFSLARRSAAPAVILADATGPPTDPQQEQASDADVTLLDSIGELATVYRFASVVFVGGSLVPRGGHNIIEAAAHGKAVIVGPYTDNFKAIVSDFDEAGGLVQLGKDDLADVVASLSRAIIGVLRDPGMAGSIGLRARELLDRNRGATDCTVRAIRSLILKQ